MNIPKWVLLFFSDFFNGSQLQVINENWNRFSQLSFNTCSREQLLHEAETIIKLSNN
jgi:hypothetical protein